jgi:hypothetical protein
VTPPAPSVHLDPPGQQHEREAQLLAQLLRMSRLALLFAEAGADKTALLQHGLIPLLSRRREDRPARAPARESGVVVPLSDRRGGPTRGSTRRKEIVVYFDDWTETPVVALRECIYKAATGSDALVPPLARLGGILEVLSGRLDASFVILLDRFEVFLEAPAYEVDIALFANELVEAINQPELPANFLLSLNQDAVPRLSALRKRIPGFDDFSLKLTAARDVEPDATPVHILETPLPVASEKPRAPTDALDLPTLSSVWAADPDPGPASPPPPRAKKAKRPPVPRTEIKVEDVYALIEDRLSAIAAAQGRRPSAGPGPQPDDS